MPSPVGRIGTGTPNPEPELLASLDASTVMMMGDNPALPPMPSAPRLLVRTDHGYWGAQLVAPYVSEEVAWAVRFHQPLRYFADESVGYRYPESYDRFFGPDYVPPPYIRAAADEARAHRWYMTARLVTLYDIYFFDADEGIDAHLFDDLIARNFNEPPEGLGFDNSPVAHMWRTMIWPNNFL